MTAAADLPFTATSPRALTRGGLSRPEARAGAAARRRPALELVTPARSDAPRAPFVAVVVAVLAAGLLGLLVLNTVLAKDSFALHTLTTEGRALADREQTLSREVESLRSPQALAEAAEALNMVQAGPPAFLRLPDGAILGSALPALAPGEVRLESGEVLPAPDAAPDAAPVDEASTDEGGVADAADESETTEATAEDETTDADASTSESTAESTDDEPTSDSTTDESPAEDDQ